MKVCKVCGREDVPTEGADNRISPHWVRDTLEVCNGVKIFRKREKRKEEPTLKKKSILHYYNTPTHNPTENVVATNNTNTVYATVTTTSFPSIQVW